MGTCRPGKCSLKLSAAMIDRLRSQAAIVGRGPKLENEFRAALLDYVSSYVAKGTPAMITYNDAVPPVESSREFLDLLASSAGWNNTLRGYSKSCAVPFRLRAQTSSSSSTGPRRALA